MFYNWRWLHKVASISLMTFGIGLLIATLLEWGWLMILLAICCIALGMFWVFNDCW